MFTEKMLNDLVRDGKIKGYKAMSKGKGENAAFAKRSGKESKFRNVRTVHNGIKFDSKKEMCRFIDLERLQKLGEISYLQRQVTFVLSVCSYIADFTYYDKSGVYVVEDVKSPHTRKLPVYRIKCKMMFKERNITIKEY